MTITTHYSEHERVLTIAVSGNFAFDTHVEFRDAYVGVDAGSHFKVDLRNSTYMDSAALGMLLLLRDYAADGRGKVTILCCDSQPKKVLEVVSFDTLFDIIATDAPVPADNKTWMVSPQLSPSV